MPLPIETERCMICHELIEKNERAFRDTTDDGEPIVACNQCVKDALAEVAGESFQPIGDRPE